MMSLMVPMRGLLVLLLLAVASHSFADNLFDPAERDGQFDVRVNHDFPNRREEFRKSYGFRTDDTAGTLSDHENQDKVLEFLDVKERGSDTARRWKEHRKKYGLQDKTDSEDSAEQSTCTETTEAEKKAFRKAAVDDGSATEAEALAFDFTCEEGTQTAENDAGGEDSGSGDEANDEAGSGSTSSGDAVWSEDFNGDWREGFASSEHWHSGEGRDGYGASAYSLNDPGELATVENGELVLRSKRCDKGGKEMCAAELIGKREFTHGRVEVRAKVSNSADAFNAIWSTGRQGDGKVWPEIGEIDWAEFAQNGGGENGKPHFTVHTKGGDQWGHASVTTGNAQNTAGDGKYHTYAIERTSNEIVQLVDGKETGRITRKMVQDAGGDVHGAFDRPHVVRLNTGADNKGGWADNKGKASENSEMRIDYVRYSK